MADGYSYSTPTKKSRQASKVCSTSKKKKKKSKLSRSPRKLKIEIPNPNNNKLYTFEEIFQIVRNSKNKEATMRNLRQSKYLPCTIPTLQKKIKEKEAKPERSCEWSKLPHPKNNQSYAIDEALEIVKLFKKEEGFLYFATVILMKESGYFPSIKDDDFYKYLYGKKKLNSKIDLIKPVNEDGLYSILQAVDLLISAKNVKGKLETFKQMKECKFIPDKVGEMDFIKLTNLFQSMLIIWRLGSEVEDECFLNQTISNNKLNLRVDTSSSSYFPPAIISPHDDYDVFEGPTSPIVLGQIIKRLKNRKNNFLTSEEGDLLKVLLINAKKESGTDIVIDLKNYSTDFSSFKFFIVPTEYDLLEKSSKTFYRSKYAAEQIHNSLPKMILKFLFDIYMKKDPIYAKQKLLCYEELRLNSLQSGAVQAFVKLSSKQVDKLNRIISYYYGFRILCTKWERTTHRFDNKLISGVSDNVYLTKKLSSKKGVVSFKSINCPRYYCDALEVIDKDLSSLISNGTLLDSIKCFRNPWPFEKIKYKDTIMWKIGIDAGGGSTKLVINCCNLAKPQSLKYTHIFGLFKHAKDSYDNLKSAFFSEESLIKNRIEAIINRSSVTVYIKNHRHSEAVTFIDTSCSKDEWPEPLPLPDICFCQASQSIKMDKRQVAFKEVKKVLFLRDKDRVIGVELHDASGSCLANGTFRGHFLVEEFTENSVFLDQYLNAGVFSGDYEVLCSIFGHIGANATWPCIWCHISNTGLGKSKEMLNKNETVKRSKIELENDYKKYQSLQEKIPLFNKAKKKIVHQQTRSIRHKPLLNIDPEKCANMPVHCVLGIGKKFNDFLHMQMEAVDLMNFSTDVKQSKYTLTYIGQKLDEKIEDLMNRYQSINNQLVDFLDDKKNLEKKAKKLRDCTQVCKDTGQDEKYKESLLLAKKLEEEAKNIEINDLKDTKIELRNTIFIAKNNKIEVDELLKQWVGQSRKILFNTLRQYGIDEGVYHGGAIIGRGVLKYCSSYKDIFQTIYEEYQLQSSEIQADKIKEILHRWEEVWDIISPLFSLMTTTRRLSTEEVHAVETYSDSLHKVLTKMVETPPIVFDTVTKIQFNKSIKFHCIFSHHLAEWATVFCAIGLFAEQNVESIHAVFNTIGRMCICIRGMEKLLHEINYFNTNHDPDINKEIDTMLEYTERYGEDLKEKMKRERAIKKHKEFASKRTQRKKDFVKANDQTPEILIANTISNEVFHDTYSKCKVCGTEIMDLYMDLHKYHIHSIDPIDIASIDL